MRDQLTQYVNLLFAGVPDCEDMKQEILQNTLDRYDDLIAAGKVPEAAYRLAIAGIGDINELLGTAPLRPCAPAAASAAVQEEAAQKKKLMQAIAVACYILCPAPLLILGALGGDGMAVIGVCCLLGFIAVGTVLMIMGSTKEQDSQAKTAAAENPLAKSLYSLIWTVGLVIYFAVSFVTGAWYITWLIFLITSAVTELVKAIFDLKEAAKHEN